MTAGLPRKRFLSSEEVDEAVAYIGAAARDENVRVALIGGAAMQAYGSDRWTVDIDIAAERLLAALPPGSALSLGGEQTFAPNRVPVDVIVRVGPYMSLYEAAIEAAVRMPGIATPVARPEYLVAMKMVAARGKDDTDIEFLVANAIAPRDSTRQVVGAHLGQYAADEFDRLADEIEWRASRGRL